MRALNRPNSYTRNGLTRNGGRPVGVPSRCRSGRRRTLAALVSILVFFLFFALQAPAAAQVAASGVMRFATDEVAFIGGFAGVAADVWLIEPFGYLSHDAGVWAIQAGASVPVVRLETVRVSIRLGTSTAIAGHGRRAERAPDLWGRACASGGDSECSRRWTAQGRSRCRAAACSSTGEDCPVAPRHRRRHQAARTARPDPAHAPRDRTALRRLDRPGRDPHADLRSRDDRLPENSAPDQAPAAAPETPGAGRVPRRRRTTGSPGRRTPEGG